MRYLYPKQVLFLHQEIARQLGGEPRVRDIGLLESAVFRPQATFGGQDLYPDLFSKVAALGHSLIRNHPFVDGNKRAGYAAMRMMLKLNGLDLHASEDARFKFVVAIAAGEVSEQQIADWLRAHSRPLKTARK